MGAMPAGYWNAITLSVMDRIRDALRTDSTMEALADQLQVPGVRAPNENEYEWIAYYPMTLLPMRRPWGFFQGSVMAQVTCAARLANALGAPQDTQRPSKIASVITRALSSKQVRIYSWDETGTRGDRMGVLSVHECSEAYVNQRSGSASGVPGSLGIGIPIDAHAAILTLRGVTDAQV